MINYKLSAVCFCIYVLLQSIYNLNAKNCWVSHDSTLVVFTKSEQTLGNTRTFGLVIADVDLDDDNDVFISNYLSPSRLWLNNGFGYFTLQSQDFGSGLSATHDADIADLNGDMYPDIFVVNHDEPSKMYFNNGNGNFNESSQTIGTVGEYPITIQLIDIDGDSDVDAYIYNISGPNRIWLNDGNGLFTMRNVDYGGPNSNRQVLADLNDDQFPDMYISYRTQNSQIWMNDGAGNFTNSGQSLGFDNDNIDFADVDDDEDIDILEANLENVTIWLNQNNTGTFTEGFTLNEGSVGCKLFDVDLDGDNDLLTTHFDNGNKLWLNDGLGGFTFSTAVFDNTRAFSIDCADIDSDLDIDIIIGQEEDTGGNSIYFNETILSGIDNKQNLEVIEYKLSNNYPNPFNPTTTISYQISELSFVTLKVYDVLGNEVRTLLNEEKQAGFYEVNFVGSELASGIYFYQLKSNSFFATKKMLLLK